MLPRLRRRTPGPSPPRSGTPWPAAAGGRWRKPPPRRRNTSRPPNQRPSSCACWPAASGRGLRRGTGRRVPQDNPQGWGWQERTYGLGLQRADGLVRRIRASGSVGWTGPTCTWNRRRATRRHRSWPTVKGRGCRSHRGRSGSACVNGGAGELGRLPPAQHRPPDGGRDQGPRSHSLAKQHSIPHRTVRTVRRRPARTKRAKSGRFLRTVRRTETAVCQGNRPQEPSSEQAEYAVGGRCGRSQTGREGGPASNGSAARATSSPRAATEEADDEELLRRNPFRRPGQDAGG